MSCQRAQELKEVYNAKSAKNTTASAAMTPHEIEAEWRAK